MKKIETLRKLVAHYEKAIAEYKKTKDVSTLFSYNVARGVCMAAEETFGIKVKKEKWMAKETKASAYAPYWYPVIGVYSSFEVNLDCLQYRLDRLKCILARAEELQTGLMVFLFLSAIALTTFITICLLGH